jgi:hypothetical protein
LYGAAVTDLAGNAAAQGTLGSFTVSVGSVLDHLLVTSEPPNAVTAGVPFGLTVTVLDALGHVDTSFTGGVILSFAQNPGKATLGGTLNVTPANGVAAFTGLTINIAAAGYTLQASSAGLQAVTTTSVTINPAAASTLIVAGFPSPTTAGTPQSFTVTALDAFGNITTGYRGTVRFRSSDPQAALPGNYLFTASNAGVSTLTATLKTAGSESITATDTTQVTVTGFQTGITVTPASVSTLLVSGFPASTVAGVAHTFNVTAKDAYGNTVTTYLGTVRFATNDSQGVVPGPYTFLPGDSGTHAFSATLKTAGSRTISASDAAATTIQGVEGGIVSPGPLSNLHVTGYPSPSTAGAAHSFTLAARDAYTNTIPNFAGTVHFTSTDPNASLPADYTFMPSDYGVHVFTASFVTAGYQYLKTADIAAGVTTPTGLKVLPATAVSLKVTGYPSPVAKGTVHSFTVTLYDAFGNVATGYTGTIHFNSDDLTAIVPPDWVFTAADNGQRTFSATFNAAGVHWLRATDLSLTGFYGVQTGIQVN